MIATVAPPIQIVAAPGAAPILGTLDELRRKGVQLWALLGWVGFAGLIVHHLATNGSAGLPSFMAIGAAANAMPTAMALRGRYDADARLVMGGLAAFLPAMLVFRLGGHAWQMDAHMYFFVAMAGLVVLADWRPIAMATVLVALHHLVLHWLAPDWVFTGSGNLGRVLFHAVAVILQFGVLGLLTVRLEGLVSAQDATIDHTRELAAIAEDERRRAEMALAKAHAAEREAARERGEREAAAARVATERRGELVTLANEFERSVTSVVKAISVATARLEASAAQLDDSTQDANGAVMEVTQGACRAAEEISQVTTAIRGLSASIRIIAGAATDQSALSAAASVQARHSVDTIARLEVQAGQIGSLVDDIREIAGKTNLLALNATIEAARAGEAGRGFTVVAGEVKSLAGDTTRASDKISSLLDGIRNGVANSAATLRQMNDAISQVAAAADGIAIVVEDHRTTAIGVEDHADQATRTAAEIERRIGVVADATGVAATLCTSLRGSASELGATARELSVSTDLFVTFLRDGV